MPPAATITADEAIAGAAAADIWLFRGRSMADRAIRVATNAPVNHVSMVVALDDLPPLLYGTPSSGARSRTCGPATTIASAS